jgi:ParB family chromosome partitioning protein
MKKDFTKEVKRTLTKEVPTDLLEEENKKLPEGAQPNARAFLINLDRIKEDKEQPRKHFDEEYLEKLATSIKEYGVLSPINVSYVAKSNYYRIIAGANRFRAAKKAGLKDIPCIVTDDMEPKERLILQLTENLMRENLNPIEEAEGYSRLMEISQMKQQEVAAKVGKDKSEISRSLKLLSELTPEEKKRIRVAPAQLLSKSLILEALRAPDLKLREKILRAELNRIEARKAIREALKATGRPKHYVFKYKGDDFAFRIKFPKTEVSVDEVRQALQFILDSLKDEDTQKEELKKT